MERRDAAGTKGVTKRGNQQAAYSIIAAVFTLNSPVTQWSALPMVLLFLAIGLGAGVLSGLFGIGGGILIIPSLIFLAKFHAKLAIGTSLGAMLLPVGLLGAYAYYQQGNLSMKASLFIGVGLFFGAYLGAKLAQGLSGATLQRMFAVFIVLMAIRLWVEAGKT
jgi:uncharacterized protein